MNFNNYTRTDYAEFADSLQCSEEVLFAIEIVTGENFEREENSDDIIENDAYQLWAEGGREKEILAALPLTNGGAPFEDGDEIFWESLDGVFAEFDGEKWILREQ